MEVGPARLDEARAVAELQVRTWQAAYPGIVPEEYLASLSVEKFEKMWHGTIIKGVPQLLVARESETQLGWVAFGPSRDQGAAATDAEIWAIYVGVPHWGRGVGRQLWLQARERMRAQGFESVSLWAFPENQRAGRFYAGLGFEVDPKSHKQFTLGGAQLNEIRFVRRIETA